MTDNDPFDFVAIDFETADYGRDSACAVGLVRVEEMRIVHKEVRLIRPPRREFVFTDLHGIAWEHVANEPVFADVWNSLSHLLAGTSCLVAHNAEFDRGVLQTCCESAGLPPPSLPFVCTMKLARDAWRVFPTKLPDVCRYLGIPLNHHEAGSDAEACARIVLAAREQGRSMRLDKTR